MSPRIGFVKPIFLRQREKRGKKEEEKNELEKKKKEIFDYFFKKRENNIFPKWKNSRRILFLQRWCQILCVAWSPSHLPPVTTRSVSSLFACFVIENKQAKKWIYIGNCFHCEEQDVTSSTITDGISDFAVRKHDSTLESDNPACVRRRKWRKVNNL